MTPREPSAYCPACGAWFHHARTCPDRPDRTPKESPTVTATPTSPPSPFDAYMAALDAYIEQNRITDAADRRYQDTYTNADRATWTAECEKTQRLAERADAAHTRYQEQQIRELAAVIARRAQEIADGTAGSLKLNMARWIANDTATLLKWIARQANPTADEKG